MPKIHIVTLHVCSAFAAKAYTDPGTQSYHQLDRQIDFISYRKYELAETPELALRIEYTAFYNAVQVMLARMVRFGHLTDREAHRGFEQWLSANPIPEDLPRTPLSIAFCPLPDMVFPPQQERGEGL